MQIENQADQVGPLRLPFLSDPDVIAVRASYCAALERYPPPLADAGRHVLDRVSSSNWTLEWVLPRWLGDAFGLQSDVSHALMLSNVYGLAYIRLQDDLVDGDLDQASRGPAILLATALYHQWMWQYVQLFEATSPFWGHFERFVAQWLRATLDSNRPPASDSRSPTEEDLLRLGERGAPLKICCVGACLLADREAAIPDSWARGL